jgi:tetratricopeptide (TPR) repeat protein
VRRYSLALIIVCLLSQQSTLAQTERFQGTGVDLGKYGPPGTKGSNSGEGRAEYIQTPNGPQYRGRTHVPSSEMRTYYQAENPNLTPAQALYQQNRAIQQYSNIGYQLEAKKQWENAEKAFNYVLKVSLLRDGVGSPKMVPILQHLAVVASEQKHYQEAIGFQERVVAFAKNKEDVSAQVMAQTTLAKLFFFNQDSENAESTMREAYVLSQQAPTLSDDKKRIVTRTFGKILRAENKVAEAMQVDPDPGDSEPLQKDAAHPTADAAGGKPTDSAASKSGVPAGAKQSEGAAAKPGATAGTKPAEVAGAKTSDSTTGGGKADDGKAGATATSPQKTTSATNN